MVNNTGCCSCWESSKERFRQHLIHFGPVSGKGNQYPNPQSKCLAGEDSYILLTVKRGGSMLIEIKVSTGKCPLKMNGSSELHLYRGVKLAFIKLFGKRGVQCRVTRTKDEFGGLPTCRRVRGQNQSEREEKHICPGCNHEMR